MILLSEKIKDKAKSLGFSACGIARAEFLKKDADYLKQWLDNGFHGEMKYMENHYEMRLDPRILVENSKSVISLAYNYYSTEKQAANAPVISKYAYGKDYHIVIREKLNELLKFIQQEDKNTEGRGFVDSAPVLEKTWAQKSGIGWVGKNSNIIIHKKGSFHFLAELIVTIELEYDEPTTVSKCGTCTKCIDSCPTGAIIKPYVIDSTKCISYLTIELKGNLPKNTNLAGRMYGCDICQDVCPWNIRFASENNEPQFKPLPQLLSKTANDWKNLTEDEFKKLFKDSAVKRTKYYGLKRNIDNIED